MENKKPKILIVDDDESTRSMYAEVFASRGFEVIQAQDGVEGLDKATTGAPKVVFTGIVMPRMDGFTMIESLKKNIATKNVPVVISSHLGREEDRQRANELRVAEFIIRDVTPPKEAVDKVVEVLEKANVYYLPFDANSPDAQKIAQELGLPKDFVCPDCHDKMMLKINLRGSSVKKLEAEFSCDKCR